MIETLQSWEQEVESGLVLRGLHTEPGERPLVHFLHGNGFCGLVYWPWLRALLPEYGLLLSDAQGHGRSDAGPRFLGWNRNAELALQVLERQRERWPGQPVYGVGHSFGGILTLLMAAERPQLFDRLILLDPILFTRPMIGLMALSDTFGLYRRNAMASRARSRQQVWPDRETAWNYFHERGIFKGWAPESLAAYIDYALKPRADGGLELCCPPRIEAAIFSSFPRGLWSAVKKVQVPTTIIYGQSTYPFVPKAAQLASRLNPRIRAIGVPGRHCFMQEYPEETGALVRSLLEQSMDVDGQERVRIA